MKTHLLYPAVLFLIIVLFSCKSIEKMVDEGRYDDAIYHATKKLAGKKNKKTKHIQALEEAFAKVNAQELDRIAYLKTRGDSSTWDVVYNLYSKIEWRQNRISGFLPLISKEGYVADFDFVETEDAMHIATINSTTFYYNAGKQTLEAAKVENSKWLARQSYADLKKANHYFSDYKDSRSLLIEAQELGTTHVLITWEDQFQTALPGHTISNGMNYRSLNHSWTAFYNYHPENVVLDQIATIRMLDLYISPEREEVNNIIERRTLESWVDATDRRGRAVLDTAGNVVQVLQTEEIEARITDVRRFKDFKMGGLVEVVNYASGDLMHSEPWEVNINFASEACRVYGDRRALTEGSRKRIGSNIEPFPTDFALMANSIELMNEKSYRILERINWNQEVSQPYVIR